MHHRYYSTLLCVSQNGLGLCRLPFPLLPVYPHLHFQCVLPSCSHIPSPWWIAMACPWYLLGFPSDALCCPNLSSDQQRPVSLGHSYRWLNNTEPLPLCGNHTGSGHSEKTSPMVSRMESFFPISVNLAFSLCSSWDEPSPKARRELCSSPLSQPCLLSMGEMGQKDLSQRHFLLSYSRGCPLFWICRPGDASPCFSMYWLFPVVLRRSVEMRPCLLHVNASVSRFLDFSHPTFRRNPTLDTSKAAVVPHSQVNWTQVGHIPVPQCFKKSVVLWLQLSGRWGKSGPYGVFI